MPDLTSAPTVILTFPGHDVDRWLEGITFQATLVNGKLRVTPTPETKKDWERMDTDMWTKWAVRYANEKFASTLKRKQGGN